jgi:hypothetical protein
MHRGRAARVNGSKTGKASPEQGKAGVSPSVHNSSSKEEEKEGEDKGMALAENPNQFKAMAFLAEFLYYQGKSDNGSVSLRFQRCETR